MWKHMLSLVSWVLVTWEKMATGDLNLPHSVHLVNVAHRDSGLTCRISNLHPFLRFNNRMEESKEAEKRGKITFMKKSSLRINIGHDWK